MKITRVETIPVDKYLFVRVHTDTGLTGLGESGVWGYLEASEKIIEKFGRYLVGQDPLRIEHHWNYLYRAFFFRGAAITGALSAVDIALWDILGKHLGVPIYQLMGGKTRDKARVYLDIGATTVEGMIERIHDAKARGYTAVGHVSLFPWETRTHTGYRAFAADMSDAIDAMRRYREAAGPDMDLCVELHRALTPSEAITLARGIEPYHPLFYEDPIRPDNFDAMGQVAASIPLPVATGERLQTIWDYEMLFARGAAQYVRPSLGMCGGLSAGKKIAAMAEAKHIGVVPHTVSSPLTTAVSVQLAACIPNYVIQEYPNNEGNPIRDDIFTGVPKPEGGYLPVPDAPGHGVELAADAATRYPPTVREIFTKTQFDGSVDDA